MEASRLYYEWQLIVLPIGRDMETRCLMEESAELIVGRKQAAIMKQELQSYIKIGRTDCVVKRKLHGLEVHLSSKQL